MAVRIESQAEPIPGYKLVERLGGGGFGEVWKVIAPGGIFKAIKFVYGDLQATSEDGQRATQELKALTRVKQVRHPYLLSIERFDIIDNQLLIVMELADRNLWDRFRDCRGQGLTGIPREELLSYMAEAAEALDLMNIEYQLQHLDIKPQNLFLVSNHAKVADFGLVKDLEGIMASVTGGVTPVYAAPETFDGWVSRFSDQYSLAIVYQELLTGQRPFLGTNVRQLIMQHLQSPPNLSPLPPCDREAIDRALAKNPDSRFPKCLDLVRALQRSKSSAPAMSMASTQQTPISSGSRQDHVEASEMQAGDTPEQSPDLGLGTAPPTPPDQDSAGVTRWIRVQDVPQITPEVTPPRPAPPQPMEGEGVLYPALVIGLGHLGLKVLQSLRGNLHYQFGSIDEVPNLRLLYLDTDPEGLNHATWGNPGAALTPSEVLLTKLNRPRHYLRSHDGRETLDSWLHLKMLYRIPRNPETTGLRALGRLAFMDQYRLIARRLQSELEACTEANGLATAAQKTGLGLRQNWPRVYVVTGLAGGTGSGMFLDLAYVLRQLLKQRGYEKPEIVGLFLLPVVDRHPGRTPALGNTFAALTELHHFSSLGTTFVARYDEKEAPINDAEAPFQQCVALQLPDVAEAGLLQERLALAADFLYRNLTTPFGRAADANRAQLASQTRPARGLTCQTFGLFRISWPRQALLRRVGRRLGRQLIDRWITKDAAPVREKVKTTAALYWEQGKLSGEHLMAQLEKACESAFNQAPQSILTEAMRPLDQLDKAGPDTLRSTFGSVLDRVEQIVGRPDDSNRGGVFGEPLAKATDALVADRGAKLAKYVVQLIEQPGFRLAGAEEAVRCLIKMIEEVLQHHENLAKELTGKVAEAHARIGSLLGSLQATSTGNRRNPAAIASLMELLPIYSQWRYQGALVQNVAKIYISLRGNLSDQLREINFCRTRLGELLRSFENSAKEGTAGEEVSWGRNVFQPGCRTLPDAVKQMTQAITVQDLEVLDRKVQELIQQQFRALVDVCLASSNLLDELEAAMQREVEAFVGSRLAGTSVAEMYLARHSQEGNILEDLVGMFEEATPELAGPRTTHQREFCLLATPSGTAGEQLCSLAQQALSDREFIVAPSTDDIVLYREVPQVRLADLEQLGPLAYEAYRLLSSVEHFTPHSRIDIKEWRAAGG
jgi:serine/threonine protein kinase